MLDTTTIDDINIDDSELDELRTARGVLALTDEQPDDALDAGRRAAAMLAAELGVPLTLHDRSRETFGETPHHEGPVDAETARAMGRGYLVEQMEEALELGVPEVNVVITSVPMVRESVEDALTASGADVVVVPTGYRPRNLFTRLQVMASERGWVSPRLPGTTLRAATDGRLSLVEPLIGTDRHGHVGHQRWPPDAAAA